MALTKEHENGPYIAVCDGEDCHETREVFGNTLQYAREDVIQTHGWELRRNPAKPSRPLTLCEVCSKETPEDEE